MIRARPTSLRLRLVLLILLSLLPLFGLALYDAFDQRADDARRAKAQALDVARLAAATQGRHVEEARLILTALSRAPDVRRGDAKACSALLASLLPSLSSFVNLGVAAAPGGDVVCSALPLRAPVNVADRRYFREALRTRGFAVGDYQIGRITGRASVNFGYPLLDDHGRAGAVLFAALGLSGLRPLVAQASLPPGSSLLVLDRHGTVLARYPQGVGTVGRRLPDVPLVRAVLAQGEGVAEATGLDGVRRFYGFSPLAGTPAPKDVIVTVGIPKAKALAAADTRLRQALTVIAAVALLALAATLAASRLLITRPLEALQRAAERLATGDLSTRTGIRRGPRELVQLAGALDTMGEALERRTDELRRLNEDLERRVAERTAELDRFFTLAPEMLCIANLDGYFVRVNPTFQRTLGYSVEELVSRPFLDFVHPDDRRATLEAMERLSQGLDVVSFENRYRRRDGSYRWILWSSTAVPQMGLIYAAARDITDRKATETDVERALTQLRAVLDAVTDGVALIDRQGRLILFNDRYRELAREAFGRDLAAEAPPADLQEALADLTTDPGGYRATVAAERLDPEGTDTHEWTLADSGRVLLRHSGPVRAADGTLLGRIVVWREVTAEREAERVKSELISTVSHELRTPLTSVYGYAELLAEREYDRETLKRYLGTIRSEAGRLTALIDDLLDLQQIEAGRLELSRRTFDIRLLLEEKVVLFAGHSDRHTIDLVLPDEPLPVLADRDRVSQVVANLLSNAIKYSPAGGAVVVRAEALDTGVRVSVTDEGLGIPADQQGRVFSKFFRADSSDTRGIGGTGLGLALCKEIVEAHGGRIGFVSEEGRGSTFWFELPAAGGP